MSIASPPHSPRIVGDFDEIDIGPPPQTPVPQRNGGQRSPLSNATAFYSITQGFSIDEEDEEGAEADEANKFKAMEPFAPVAVNPANPAQIQAKEGDEAEANENCPPVDAFPLPPSPFPLSAVHLPMDIGEEGRKEEPVKERPFDLAQEHVQPPPQQHSPPPIYTTVCPPGMYPAIVQGQQQMPACYAAPQNGIPPQQQHVPAAYIIDAGVLNGMPAVLIHHQGSGQCIGEHNGNGPVLIISDPYAEWVRRRRAMALISFTLLFFPTLFFLLLLYSMSYNY